MVKELIRIPDVEIYIGGAKGVDTMMQEFLIANAFDPKRVFVYDRRDEDNRVSKEFQHKNGFSSFTERDEALTAVTTEDLAFCHQYGGGGSGTFQNVVRRKYGAEVARGVTALFRKHSCAYQDGAIAKLCK